MAVTLEQAVGFTWAPASGRVPGEQHAAVLPSLQDGIHDPPRLLHLVGADEQRGVADEDVEEQALVPVAAGLGERLRVGEVHRDAAYLEGLARHLGTEAEGDALVGLDAKD